MAQVPSTISPLSLTYVVDPGTGRPIVGALLTVFKAGTTSPATAYTDATLTSTLEQPIKTTGSGRFPPVYIGPGFYRYRVTDPQGAILDDLDGVQGAVVTEEINNIVDTGSQMPTASLTDFYGTDTPAGWVRANGKTIGNAVSGATERGDADTKDLFIQLWGADPTLAVSGGRGNTATEDYNQGKAIALPDLRRIVRIGLDGMGNGYRVPNAPTDPRRMLGVTFGEEVHLISIAEMPTHTHAISCDVEGGHIHNAACDIQGLHSHGASADVQGSHAHTAGMDIQGGHIHGTSMDQQGDHTHSASMKASGGHNHAASMDAAGDHAHQATTDVQGQHNHTYTRTTYRQDGPVNSNYSSFVRATEDDYGQNTSDAGAHGHNINVQNNGNHIHNVYIQNAGSHLHDITLVNSGAHAHTVTLQDAGEHQHDITVQANGSHSHTIMVNAAGQHQHNISIADAGEHSHVVVAGPTGGSAAHNNMQPSMAVTVLIKL